MILFYIVLQNSVVQIVLRQETTTVIISELLLTEYVSYKHG